MEKERFVFIEIIIDSSIYTLVDHSSSLLFHSRAWYRGNNNGALYENVVKKQATIFREGIAITTFFPFTRLQIGTINSAFRSSLIILPTFIFALL